MQCHKTQSMDGRTPAHNPSRISCSRGARSTPPSAHHARYTVLPISQPHFDGRRGQKRKKQKRESLICTPKLVCSVVEGFRPGCPCSLAEVPESVILISGRSVLLIDRIWRRTIGRLHIHIRRHWCHVTPVHGILFHAPAMYITNEGRDFFTFSQKTGRRT